MTYLGTLIIFFVFVSSLEFVVFCYKYLDIRQMLTNFQKYLRFNTCFIIKFNYFNLFIKMISKLELEF